MEYVINYNGDNMKCIEHGLDAILTVTNDNIKHVENALCLNMYPILLY